MFLFPVRNRVKRVKLRTLIPPTSLPREVQHSNWGIECVGGGIFFFGEGVLTVVFAKAVG